MARWTRASLLVASALAHTACEDVRRIDLVFATNNRGLPQGFTCRGDDDLPLANRSVTAGDGSGAVVASAVVDFIDIGEIIDCRAPRVLDWCAEHSCRPLVEHRVCIPLDYRATSPDEAVDQLHAALLDLAAGAGVTSEAPDGELLVRVVAIAQRCDELLDRAELDCSKVMGCVRSCPVRLDTAAGQLLLDLDDFGVGRSCESDVMICASDDLRAEAEVCEAPPAARATRSEPGAGVTPVSAPDR